MENEFHRQYDGTRRTLVWLASLIVTASTGALADGRDRVRDVSVGNHLDHPVAGVHLPPCAPILR